MPNCRVAEGPLRFFLPDAAGFILDFPSTTFLEALLTEKPIFILFGSALDSFGSRGPKRSLPDGPWCVMALRNLRFN
jgi:hypothetical protein